MKIGIDIMGGDYAPVETVKGVLLAQEALQDDNKFLSDQEKIEPSETQVNQ